MSFPKLRLGQCLPTKCDDLNKTTRHDLSKNCQYLHPITLVHREISAEMSSNNIFFKEWENPNTKWIKEDHDNIIQINVNPEMTWIPDVLVYAK